MKQRQALKKRIDCYDPLTGGYADPFNNKIVDEELRDIEAYCEKEFKLTHEEYENKVINSTFRPQAKDAYQRPTEALHTIEKNMVDSFHRTEKLRREASLEVLPKPTITFNSYLNRPN